MSLDYQTRQLNTGNTRQPELNSRVPRDHSASRAQLEGCHSEPQLKECHVLKIDVSPSSDSSPARQFLENSRNPENPVTKPIKV